MKESFKLKFKKINQIKDLPPRDQGHYLPISSFPHGCPLGGFGAGTIGRSPYGDFNVWHIKIGAHIHEEIKSCCFHSFQKIIGKEKVYLNTLTAREYNSNKLKEFAKPFSKNNGYYSAAYPKSKYLFIDNTAPASITCEQYSPILPNNYKETSYPIAVFNHTIKNRTQFNIEVAVMLTWANMTGWGFEDQRPGIQDNWFSFIQRNTGKKHSIKISSLNAKKIVGIVMSQKKEKINDEMDGEITIASCAGKDEQITYQEYFYTNGTGLELYQTFAKDGTLSNNAPHSMLSNQNYGSAIAVKIKLKPYEEKQIPFMLVWDLPMVNFGKDIIKQKYYTNYFSASGKNSWKIALEGFKNYKAWSNQIDAWHNEIISKSKMNKILKNKTTINNYFKMLINELYFLSDGGTFWDAKTNEFGLLECYDYPFYETLDVRFYGSFPLLKFWPEIELSIMDRFSKAVIMRDNKNILFNYYAYDKSKKLPVDPNKKRLFYGQKKISGAVPHDLGSPKNNPFDSPAEYTWQNTNYWKDLNPKFILLIFRDYKVTRNKEFLKKNWKVMNIALNYLLKMDKDKDGIPENEGFPDQTYDNWIMEGVSAYCGSLWIASLYAMHECAIVLNDFKNADKYNKLYQKAKEIFNKKLWNGLYYDFCEKNNDIMIDQLIGQWYISLFSDDNLVPGSNIVSALQTIHKYNFKKTKNGKWGAVSGKKFNNQDVDSEQGRDVWVGANFALCSLFIHNKMIKEAEGIINSLSKNIYDKGFFFRTPEGWDTKGQFTATMYMRPNAIWSLEF